LFLLKDFVFNASISVSKEAKSEVKKNKLRKIILIKFDFFIRMPCGIKEERKLSSLDFLLVVLT